MSKALRNWGIVTLVTIGALVAFFKPILSIKPYQIPSTYPDALDVCWIINWAKLYWSGVTNSFYHTDYLFTPFGADLYLHAAVEGLILPLTVLFQGISVAGIYTLACTLCFILNLFSASYLFKVASGSACLGAALGLLFTFHPYFIGHLDAGHLNILCFFPVLLAHAAFFNLLWSERASRASCIIYCLSLAALPFLNIYYSYFCALSLGAIFCISLFRLKMRPIYLGRVIVLTVIGHIPPLFKIWMMAQAFTTGSYTPDHDPALHSADLISYFVPGFYQVLGQIDIFSSYNSRVKINPAEATSYLGVALILAAIISLMIRWRASTNSEAGLTLYKAILVIPLTLFFLLSLGPEIQVGGSTIGSGYGYITFASFLPFFPSVPARFSILVALFLFLIVAQGFKSISATEEKGKLISLMLLLIVLGVEYFPRPLRIASIEPSAVLLELAQATEIQALHDTSAVLQYPMIRQIYHGKKITTAFLSRRPKKPLMEYRKNPFLRFLNSGKTTSDEALKEGFNQLKIQAVIVEQEQGEIMERIKSVPFLKEKFHDDKVVVYTHLSER